MTDHQSRKNKNAPQWQIRGIRDGDEIPASRLFNRIFDKSITPAQYRWKLADAPFPVGCPATWVADDGGEIVGQYGGTPMRFWLNGQVYPIVHICDVMTHPDFRGQGILSALGVTANDAWRDAGVAFATGFPHAGWGSRRNYLGWQMMYKSMWMWRPLRIGNLLRRRFQNRSLENGAKSAHRNDASVKIASSAFEKCSNGVYGDIRIERIETPGKAFDELWETLKYRYSALVVRDRAWIKYRYADAPEMGYGLLFARKEGQPAGYLAFRIREVNQRIVGYIADLFTAPNDLKTRVALLRHARKCLYHAGAAAMLGVVGEKTPMRKAFRRCGFIRRYGAFEVSIIPYRDDLALEVLRDPNCWFSMGGDFDII